MKINYKYNLSGHCIHQLQRGIVGLISWRMKMMSKVMLSAMSRKSSIQESDDKSSTAYGMSIIKREQTAPWRMSIGAIA